MKTTTEFKNQGADARRLVWAVAVVGITAGGITLAAFGFSIYQAHSNQATINSLAAAWDGLLLNVNEMLATSQRTLPVLLSGQHPPKEASDAAQTLSSLKHMASEIVRTDATAKTFDALYASLRQLERCDDSARQWLTQYLAVESSAGPIEGRVHAAETRLSESLDMAAGRQRLQSAVRLRELRAKGTVVDAKILESIAHASVGDEGLSTAQKELAEVVLLVEQTRNAANDDALSDLKDNRFAPALARLRRGLVKIDRTSDAKPMTTNAGLLDDLRAAVFGNPAGSDDDRPTITVGGDSFFRLCQQRLELARQRKELQARALTALTTASDAKVRLSKLVRETIQLLSSSSTEGFERAWGYTLAIAAVCALLFLLLSVKAANILRQQFLDIMAATNVAQASEQRVRQLINASLDGVVTMDETGVISGWNTRAEQILGWKTEEAVGLLAADTLFPEPLRKDFRRWVREFLELGRQTVFNQRIEARSLHRNGWEIPVDLAIVPLCVGQQYEFNVFLQDITQRKQNEFAIARVLAESPSLANAVPRVLAEICAMHQWDFGALWLVDAKADVVRCFDTWRDPASRCDDFETATRRSTFARGVGLPGRVWLEGRTMSVSDLADEPQLSQTHEALKSGLCGVIAFPIASGNDVLGVLEVFSATVREANDEMLLTLSTVGSRLGQFIEREQADQALRLAEAKSRGILDAIPDVVLLLSADKAIGELRVPAGETEVYPADRMLGKCLPDALPPHAADLISACVDTALRTGEVQTVEYFLVDQNDKSRDYEARVAPMGDSFCLLLARDVSDRNLLQSQLAQAQKLESIGQLAAGIAHEINTPIQYIGDNTRFLQDSFANVSRLLTDYSELLGVARTSTLTPERLAAAETDFQQADVPFLIQEIPAAIDQSLDGVERVATIVRAMKNFSHPECDQKQLTDLNQCIENTILVARNEWKYLADLTTDLDPHLPLVSCLAGEFNQVVLNLIVNAAHAIGDVVAREGNHKGMITITTRACDDYVEIRIGDTGSGIPESIRGRIFDPFFTTKEVGRGTGQGLAIAYSVIVDKHGGAISFETELGRGTTFIIRLPVTGQPLDGAPPLAANAFG